MSRNQKYILLTILILLFGGVATGLFLRYSRGPEPSKDEFGNFPNTDGRNEKDGENIDAEHSSLSKLRETGKLRQISTGRTAGASFVGKRNEIRYIDVLNGNMFETLPGGESRKISEANFLNVERVDWSGEGNAALLTYNPRRDTALRAYLSVVGTTTAAVILPQSYSAAIPDPFGTHVAFIKEIGTESSIGTSRPDGTQNKNFGSLPLRDLVVQWGTGNNLIVSNRATAAGFGAVWQLSGSTPVLTIGPLHGLLVLPNRTSGAILFSSSEQGGKTLRLEVINRKGERVLAPFATLAEKCAWAKTSPDHLYCAVPKHLGKEELPDAWWKGKSTFSDTLVRWDIVKGTVERLFESDFDIINISFNAEDSALLFINKKDSSLWNLELTKPNSTSTDTAL